MAFPSVYSLLAALSLSLPFISQADELKGKDKTNLPNLELLVKTPPRISLHNLNRCPEPLLEIPRLPRILKLLPENDPRRQKIQGLFHGETSLDPKDDDLRQALLDPPLCYLPLQVEPKKPLALISEPENSDERANSDDHINNNDPSYVAAGSKAVVRLQAPGEFRYRLLGKNHNRATNGIIEYDIADKIIYFPGGYFTLPTLNLDTIFIGEASLPSLIDELNQFGQARKKLTDSLETLVDNVQRILSNKQVEAFLDWGSFFRDLLPNYTNSQGIIEPNNWQNIVEQTSAKAEEYYHEELTDLERQDLDLAIKSFENDFSRLQDQIPLVRNSYKILNSKDPLCQIKWGGLRACDFYKILLSLGDIVEIDTTEGEINLRTKELITNLQAYSSSFQQLKTEAGGEWISSHLSRTRAKVSGQAYFHAKLSEGISLEELLPEKYKEDLELLRILLGQELNMIDVEAQLQAGYTFFYRSERMRGFQSSFKTNYPYLEQMGFLINIGSIYDNYSLGWSSFSGVADSHADLLLAEFHGSVMVEQFLRDRQEIGLFLSSPDNLRLTNGWWYNANINLNLEQNRKLTESWGANFRYKSSYSGEVKQKAWSIAETKQLERWFASDFNGSLLGGFNIDWVNVMGFSDFSNYLGAGLFANLPFLSLTTEYAPGDHARASVKVPLASRLDLKEEKNHYLQLQKLAFRKLAGIDAVIQGEVRRHNRAMLPGLYLEALLSKQLSDNFFSHERTATEIGLTLIDERLSSNLNSYLSLKYIGDALSIGDSLGYSKNHGAVLSLGSDWFDLAVAYSYQKDDRLPGNTTSAEFSHTFYFGELNITQFLEMFPAAQDLQPHYEKTDKEKWNKKRDSDFRYLLQIQGQLDGVENYLARKLSEVEIDHTRITLLGAVGKHKILEQEIRTGYHLSHINLNTQVNLSLDHSNRGGYHVLSEMQYDVYQGLGPALLIDYRSLVDKPVGDKFWLLPGFAFDNHLHDGLDSELRDHHFKSSLFFLPDEKFVGGLRLGYSFFKDGSALSPYFNLELSSKLNLSKSAVDDLGSRLIVSIGLKQGPLIIAGSSQFSSEKQPLQGSFGLIVGIDYESLINER